MATNAYAYQTATEEQDATDGRPSRQRRVSDRLLAAHNHAYAVGHRRLASELKEILEMIETDELTSHDRRNISATERASRWIAYVDARSAYEDALNDIDLGQTKAARLRMTMAQELWRQGEGP